MHEDAHASLMSCPAEHNTILISALGTKQLGYCTGELFLFSSWTCKGALQGNSFVVL